MTLKLDSFLKYIDIKWISSWSKTTTTVSILLRSIDNVVFWISILIKVSPSANIFGNLNRANRQSQPPQPTATSFRYNRICSNAPKKLARSSSSAHSSPSFGCKDKIFDANAEINNNNNQEFDVAATVSHRDDPFNNRNIVESTNRSTSGSV